MLIGLAVNAIFILILLLVIAIWMASESDIKRLIRQAEPSHGGESIKQYLGEWKSLPRDLIQRGSEHFLRSQLVFACIAQLEDAGSFMNALGVTLEKSFSTVRGEELEEFAESEVRYRELVNLEKSVIEAFEAGTPSAIYESVSALSHWLVYRNTPAPPNADDNCHDLIGSFSTAITYLEKGNLSGARSEVLAWDTEWLKFEDEQDKTRILPVYAMPFALNGVEVALGSYRDSAEIVDIAEIEKRSLTMAHKLELAITGLKAVSAESKLEILSKMMSPDRLMGAVQNG